MHLLETLTRAADEEQIQLKPLPQHAAATQAEHLRRHYALLLAAVLTAQPAVSEPQTRLLRLLLESLKLGDIRGDLFTQARELTPDPLLEAARLIRAAGFAQHLVLDALVLLRLDAPLGDESARLVGELAAFLGLDETALATRAADASDILGLTARPDSTPGDATKAGADDAAQATAAETPDLLAELWPGLLSQPLTPQALRAGLQGGLWLLDADLDVDFPWQANDAILHFRNGATLNTFAKQGEIKLTGCRLFDAALNFQGACSITLERCDWRGNYDPAAHRTALQSAGQALTVGNCYMETRNARAILSSNARLVLRQSRFAHCGHPNLGGGVFLKYDESLSTVADCRFDRCVAAAGGAFMVHTLGDVTNCEFVACESLAYGEDEGRDLAVTAISNRDNNPVLVGCVFRQTSINVGDSYQGRGRRIAVNCQFIFGNMYHQRNDSHSFAVNSTFEGGLVIERAFD